MVNMEKRQQTDWLKPREVAEELGMAESTVLQWLREKKLPGYQFGNRWKVKRAELETWQHMRRNTQAPNI
jgi:excisionase family DNA binding protein